MATPSIPHYLPRDPELHHLPGTHPDVRVAGWYRIQVGRRAATWAFAAPTVD